MRAGIDWILAEEGRIDVLVNNAGYGSHGAVEDVPTEEARRQFEVDVFGAARLTQLVLPHMRQQHSGTIVNITSIDGKTSTPLGACNHATKPAGAYRTWSGVACARPAGPRRNRCTGLAQLLRGGLADAG
jgi:short-subunit dehydrogenase